MIVVLDLAVSGSDVWGKVLSIHKKTLSIRRRGANAKKERGEFDLVQIWPQFLMC